MGADGTPTRGVATVIFLTSSVSILWYAVSSVILTEMKGFAYASGSITGVALAATNQGARHRAIALETAGSFGAHHLSRPGIIEYGRGACLRGTRPRRRLVAIGRLSHQSDPLDGSRGEHPLHVWHGRPAQRPGAWQGERRRHAQIVGRAPLGLSQQRRTGPPAYSPGRCRLVSSRRTRAALTLASRSPLERSLSSPDLPARQR